MPRVLERRRHQRIAMVVPAAIRDKAGRLLMRGRTADVSPCGIRILGEGGLPMREGQGVWVEVTLPDLGGSTRRMRIVKMSGEVRRINVMGQWRSVVVVIFENDFSPHLLDPMV